MLDGTIAKLRESAYLNWCGRGRPAHDDWTDWFAAERLRHQAIEKAAYFRWLNRGAPIGDPWADWLVAEAQVGGTLTADSVYQLIKSCESQFPIPAPYVTIDVGTFDAASGTFDGLTTTVDTDLEPLPHGPNQRPINPPPRYQGDLWVSVTINYPTWRKTITAVPAPLVPLAPVRLQFTVANAVTPWSVTVNGITVSAPTEQTTLKVSVWDATHADWIVKVGAKSYTDTLRIQRPTGNLPPGGAVGAFTIPVLPVTIVYAPPADSLGKSSATYATNQTVGTTFTYDLGTDTSHTVPLDDTSFAASGDFKAILDVMAQGMALYQSTKRLGQVVSDISSQVGQVTSTQQTGFSDLHDTQMTVITSTTDGLSTNAKVGGPGVGDFIHFYKNVRVAWAYYKGQLRLCPFGYEGEESLGVAGLQTSYATLDISAENAQLLLDLDPFVSGGAQATLPLERFSFLENFDYAWGGGLDRKKIQTRDTKHVTTHKTYTTYTNDWQPGPIFKLLGLGGKDQTTTTVSNAIGDDVSTTVTLEANLVSGPEDRFHVGIYYDSLFGTYAFGKPINLPVVRQIEPDSGQAGQILQIKLSGENLEYAQQLKFDGQGPPLGVSNLVASDTEVTATLTIPASAVANFPFYPHLDTQIGPADTGGVHFTVQG